MVAQDPKNLTVLFIFGTIQRGTWSSVDVGVGSFNDKCESLEISECMQKLPKKERIERDCVMLLAESDACCPILALQNMPGII